MCIPAQLNAHVITQSKINVKSFESWLVISVSIFWGQILGFSGSVWGRLRSYLMISGCLSCHLLEEHPSIIWFPSDIAGMDAAKSDTIFKSYQLCVPSVWGLSTNPWSLSLDADFHGISMEVTRITFCQNCTAMPNPLEMFMAKLKNKRPLL